MSLQNTTTYRYQQRETSQHHKNDIDDGNNDNNALAASSIDHFPQEIWNEVAKYLDSHDLLVLRLTNRLINDRVTNNTEWLHRSLKYWIRYERANLDLLPLGSLEQCDKKWDSLRFSKLTDYSKIFGFFKLRSRSDWHVLGQLRRLCEIGDSKQYWDAYSAILRNREELLLPILYRITSQGSSGGLLTNNNNDKSVRKDLFFDVDRFELNFDVLNAAQSVLVTLRHRHMFELLFDSFDFGSPINNTTNISDSSTQFINNPTLPDCSRYLETFCLKLATMDTAFDRLLMYRSKFYDNVTRFIEQVEFDGDIKKFLTLPSTMKVDKIVTAVYRVLNIPIRHTNSTANATNSSNNQFQHPKQYYYEDFMVTRIYANEVKGHPLLLLAIIQRIGQQFGVETVMSRYYLIIKDNRLKDGETYLTISPRSYKPNIFLQKDLINLIQHNFRSVSNDMLRQRVLPNFLKPLTNQTFLRIIFDDLLPNFSSSIWTSNEFTTSMTDTNLVELADKLFPVSRHSVQHEVIKYFSSFFSIIRTVQHGEESISRHGTSGALQAVAKRGLVKLITVTYPGDLRYLKGEEDYRQARGTTYLEWLLAKHSIVIPKPEPEQKQKQEQELGTNSRGDKIDYFSLIGTFAISRNEQLVCIVGVKAMRSIGEDIKYYTVMNCNGEFFVELSTQITEFQWDTKRVADFLRLCTSHYELGLVFEGIDWEKRKLVVNKRIRSLIERDGSVTR